MSLAAAHDRVHRVSATVSNGACCSLRGRVRTRSPRSNDGRWCASFLLSISCIPGLLLGCWHVCWKEFDVHPKVDLEKPASHGVQHTVRAITPLSLVFLQEATSSVSSHSVKSFRYQARVSVTLSMPVHLRYHAPSEVAAFASVAFPQPKLALTFARDKCEFRDVPILFQSSPSVTATIPVGLWQGNTKQICS